MKILRYDLVPDTAFTHGWRTQGGLHTVDQLVLNIRDWAQAYGEGNPKITDANFDEAIALLKASDPDHKILTTPGWGYKPASEHLSKVKHRFTVGSLDKIKYDDVKAGRVARINGKFTVTPKFDGGSAVAYYNDFSQIEAAVSRGDGSEGQDITENLLPSETLPVLVPGIEWARGEVVMSWKNFELIDGSHPRNSAVGMSQSKSTDEDQLKLIEFIAYESSLPYDDGQEISELQKLGFKVAKYELMDWDTFLKKIDDPTWVEWISDGYPIDGLVLRTADNVIAFKFPDNVVTTTVKDIKWQLSRTGRMVPVASLDNRFLDGADISNATLNNYQWMKNRGIGPGAEVEIVRANLIIPKIVNTLKRVDYTPPSTCPKCDEPLVHSGVDILCVNEGCSCRETQLVWNIFGYSKVDGVDGAVLSVLMNEYQVVNIDGLKKVVDLHKDGLIKFGAMYGPATAEKVKTTFDNILALQKSARVNEILRIANISKMGQSSSWLMTIGVSPDEFKKAILEGVIPEAWSKFCKIRPAFDNMAKSVDRLRQVLDFMDGNVSPTILADKIPTKLRYCMTGSLSGKRDALVKEFAAYGLEFVDVGKAEVLIQNKLSGSDKEKTANRRGIPIITEDKFRELYVN